jgi:hypothetical protein
MLPPPQNCIKRKQYIFNGKNLNTSSYVRRCAKYRLQIIVRNLKILWKIYIPLLSKNSASRVTRSRRKRSKFSVTCVNQGDINWRVHHINDDEQSVTVTGLSCLFSTVNYYGSHKSVSATQLIMLHKLLHLNENILSLSNNISQHILKRRFAKVTVMGSSSIKIKMMVEDWNM